MSTRQLIFVGCKILGIYLVISGIANLPLVITFWRDIYGGPKDTMREMQVSMMYSNIFGYTFTLFSGMVLFFGTDWITRIIAVPDSGPELPAAPKNFTWGIALVASIYMLLLQFPAVLLVCGTLIAKQFSSEISTDDYTWQRLIWNEFPVKSLGCVVALLLAYLSLRAMYGSQPFKWWNGGGESRNDE